MLGELALSERAIADHSILVAGSQTVSANFTAGQTGTYIGVGEADMSAIAIKTTIAGDFLVGVIQATLEFTQSSASTRFATGVSGQVVSTIQTTAGTYFGITASEQDFQTIQSAAGLAFRNATSEQTSSFTKELTVNMEFSAISEQTAEFTQSTLGGAITNNPASIEAVFVQASRGNKIIDMDPVAINAVFVQTSNGVLYWERIDADTPSENWVQIVPTGGTWTEINASGIVDIWTQKVV